MSAPRGAARRALALRALALLAAAVIGWLAGHTSTAGQGAEAGRREAPAAPRERAGVSVGFPRSREGAGAAVAAYQRAFASASVLRPGVLEERVKAVATPAYVAQMLEANAPGVARIAAGAIGEGLAKGQLTLYTAVPIGYEVESFTPQRARILTWGFTLLGNASTVEPSAYFGLSHTELAWTADGWRIAQTESGFGPTPKLATAPGPLGGYDVLNLATRLRSYELAP